MRDKLYNARLFVQACHEFLMVWAMPSFTASQALIWARAHYDGGRRVRMSSIK